MEGASDKVHILKQLMQQMHSTAADQHSTQPAQQLAVYIGDSPSDLGAMLQADLGIVVGQNARLRQVADAYGVKLRPLVAGATILHQALHPVLLSYTHMQDCIQQCGQVVCTDGKVVAWGQGC